VLYQLAELARADIIQVVSEAALRFGALQRRRYSELIEAAARMIADEPLRPGSRGRDDLAPGVRSFHVELAARRHGAAAHLLYYIEAALDDGRVGVVILRVLDERMDPARHIVDEP